MVVVLLSLLLAQTAAEPEEPFPFSPEVRPVHERLVERYARGQREELTREAEQLTRLAPKNPRAWLLRGFIEYPLYRPRKTQSLLKALEFGITGESRAEALFALVAASKDKPKERALADKRLEEALALSPDGGHALGVGATLLAEAWDFERARVVLERMVRHPPVDAETHALYASVLGHLKEHEAAAKQVTLARRGGVEKDFFKELVYRGKHARHERWLWWLFLGQVAFLGTSLVGLYLAGTLLSRVQVKRLAAVDARLLRNEQTPQERLVDLLYNAVLWGGSLLFYVFVVTVVGLAVASSGALLYGMSLEGVSIKLLVVMGVNLWGLWGLLHLLWLSRPRREEKRLLTKAEAPRLFIALAEVAKVARLPRVDKVYLMADAGISVNEEGGPLKVLTGRGERVLNLGFAALRGMSVTELKAILAHEYGHFSHGETRLTPVVGSILTAVVHTLDGLEVSDFWLSYLNPSYWYLRAYFFVYLGVTQGHSRRRELLADRASALAYGGHAFRTALLRTVGNGDLYARSGEGTLVMLRRKGWPCQDLYRCLDAADALTPESLRTLRSAELTAHEADQYDSHPPPLERIKRVAGIRGHRPPETASALSLFEAPERLAQELTQALAMKVQGFIRLNEGEPPPLRTDVDPDRQERLVGAFWFHDDAMELQERRHPEADAMLVESARRLEEEVEPDEPLLVPVLQHLAGAHHRQGNAEAAEAALQRAKAVLETFPVKDSEALETLQRQLDHVRESPHRPSRQGTKRAALL
jgi:Zn-dependent protease with chaperone function